MEKRAIGAVAVVLGSAWALTWSPPASAQEWLRDRRIGEGPAYQVGDFEIHPGLGAEIGYDSNYLGRSDKTSTTLANGSPNFPPLDTAGAEDYSLPLALERRTSAQGQNPPVGVSRSARPAPTSNSSAASFRTSATCPLAPTRALTFFLGASGTAQSSGFYTRSIQPTVLGNPDLSYNSDTISANGDDLAIHPQSRHARSAFLGYTFTGPSSSRAPDNRTELLLIQGTRAVTGSFRPRGRLYL